MDTRAFKRSLHHSERYNRRGFGLGEEVAGSLQTAYQSDLIASLRENGLALEQGRLHVRLVCEGRLVRGMAIAVDGEISSMGLLEPVDGETDVQFLTAISGG